MPELDLAALVRNRTMSAEIAGTLAGFAAARRSFLVCAIPRLAGKTTVMEATLAHAPAGMPLHRLFNHPHDVDRLSTTAPGGYLVVPEASQAPVPGYVWGEPVRRVFALLEGGYSLATALHAPGVDEAFEVLTGGNGVPDAHASRLDLFVYIRSLGDDWRAPERRVVAEVHEIDGVTGGRPATRLLHRWDQAANRFEQLAAPRGVEPADVERRAAEFARAAGESPGGA